jgi:glycosyltransferase involved in cell wall biosynthesis
VFHDHRDRLGEESPAVSNGETASAGELSTSDRLLIVARELTRGGAAYLALRHAQRLSRRYAVDVLCTGPWDEVFVSEFPSSVCLYRLEPGLLEPAAIPLQTVHEFALRHRAMSPFQLAYRAVLATSIFPDWPACAAVSAVRASRRLIFLVDEGLVRYPGLGPPERAVVDHCILGADTLLPVSRRLLQRMAEHCPPLRGRAWKTLHPPVDVETILEQAGGPRNPIAEGDRPVVLTVGRLVPDKQIALGLRVHHRLKQAGLRFRWYIVGSGPEEEALRDEVRKLGMENDFILINYIDNLY